MKSSKGKGLLGLLAILLCVGLFGYFGYDTMDDIKLGLDLAGGVSITYQTLKEDPTAEEMSDTIYKLQQRVEKYSTEAEVYQEGGNRINIDIPGEKDADAVLMELGKPGSLVFMDEAGNVILTGDQVAKDDDVEFIACSVSSSSSRNNYQPTPAEGDEKARIDAKIQRSTDAIAEKAAARG